MGYYGRHSFICQIALWKLRKINRPDHRKECQTDLKILYRMNNNHLLHRYDLAEWKCKKEKTYGTIRKRLVRTKANK